MYACLPYFTFVRFFLIPVTFLGPFLLRGNRYTIKSEILSIHLSEYLHKCTLCSHHPDQSVSFRVKKLLVGGRVEREITSMSPSCHLFLELSLKDVKEGATCQVSTVMWRAEWLGVAGHVPFHSLTSHGTFVPQF